MAKVMGESVAYSFASMYGSYVAGICTQSGGGRHVKLLPLLGFDNLNL